MWVCCFPSDRDVFGTGSIVVEVKMPNQAKDKACCRLDQNKPRKL